MSSKVPATTNLQNTALVIFCCLDWYLELSGWESNVVTKSDGLCGIQHYQHYTVSVIIKDFELTELLIHVPSRYVLSISSHLKLSVHCDVKRLTSPSLKLRCEDIYNGTLIALLSVLLPSSDNTYHDAHCTRLLCSNLWKKVFLFNIRISIKMLQFEFLIEVFKLEPRFVRNVIFKFLHIIIFFFNPSHRRIPSSVCATNSRKKTPLKNVGAPNFCCQPLICQLFPTKGELLKIVFFLRERRCRWPCGFLKRFFYPRFVSCKRAVVFQ